MARRTQRPAIEALDVPPAAAQSNGGADIDAIIKALEIGGDEGSEGYTIREIIERTGHSEKWVRARLLKLKASGQLESGRRMVEALDGRMVPAPVYRLV